MLGCNLERQKKKVLSFLKKSTKDIQHVFIDLHRQQSPLLLSAAVPSQGGLRHMAVGRPADQARRKKEKYLGLRNTCISLPGVRSGNHSENGPAR